MGRMVLDQAFGRVIEATAAKVAQLGFTRRGAILRTLSQGNSGIIEFQRSTKNSSDKLLFTVNLCRDLWRLGGAQSAGAGEGTKL